MNERGLGSLTGLFIGDALAMPAHWYYQRAALRRDYGRIDGYQAPRNPHPDSILWRSQYTPSNRRGEILHEQAAYWGVDEKDLEILKFSRLVARCSFCCLPISLFYLSLSLFQSFSA